MPKQMEAEDLAEQLALQGLKIEEDDLPGLLAMARDIAEAARSMRGNHAYALESLNGFRLPDPRLLDTRLADTGSKSQ